jgi:hypothetical protein
MPEAEVALRLAEYLSERPGFGGHIEVAMDGASVRVAGTGRNAWAIVYHRGHALALGPQSGLLIDEPQIRLLGASPAPVPSQYR